MRRRSFARALGAVLVYALVPVARAEPGAKRAPVVAAKPVQAPPKAEAPKKLETLIEVSVLHGTQQGRENDPRIGDMPELREGPFAKYSSYQLLSRTELELTRGGKRELKLPNGRRLEVHLENRSPDGSSRLVASINRPGASDFLPLLEVKAKPGQAFIVAGQSYKRGILVLVFKVLR
jgi:hypothetical protein